MRHSGGQRLSMLLLLLACAAAKCSPSHAGGAPLGAPEVEAVPTDLLGFFRPIIADPTIQQCWTSLLGTQGCVTSVFQSVLLGHLQLNSSCCEAVEGLGDYCVPKMFVLPAPLGNLIPTLIKGFCAAPAPAAPPKA